VLVDEELTLIEQTALRAYRVARSRGLPEEGAIDAASGVWYAHEPSADLAAIRQRLNDLITPRTRIIPVPKTPLPRRTGTT
jgi:hypothetical protein